MWFQHLGFSRAQHDSLGTAVMPLSGKDSLNFLFMVGSTALIGHGALARQAVTEADGYMRLHPFFMGLAFSLMISLGFWMLLDGTGQS